MLYIVIILINYDNMITISKLQSFLASRGVHADEFERNKNVIKFEVKDSKEVFNMYRLNYKHMEYEGYDIYFMHETKKIFSCTLNKLKN